MSCSKAGKRSRSLDLGQELERTQDAIAAAARVRPKYFRPPSGTTGPHFAGALKRPPIISLRRANRIRKFSLARARSITDISSHT